MKEVKNIDNRELDELFEKYRRAPDGYVFVVLADACRKIDRVEEALEICGAGVARHPTYASGYVVLGKCHYDLGQLVEAREKFEKVLALDPSNLVALKFLGTMDAEAGRHVDARNHFQQILALDPSNKEILKTLHTVEEQQQIDGGETAAPVNAEGTAEPAPAEPMGVEEHTADTDAPLETSDELATATLADIFAGQGYTDKALKIYGEILKKRPGHVQTRQKVLELGGEVPELEPVENAGKNAPSRSDGGVAETTGAAPDPVGAEVKQGPEHFKRWLDKRDK